MKGRTRLQLIVGSCVIAFAVCSALPRKTAAQNGGLLWNVRLSPDNPDYIEVKVDATNLRVRGHIERAVFSVIFYDAQNRQIKTEFFNFLDNQVTSLSGTYLRVFKHSSNQAVRAQGVWFKGLGRTTGSEEPVTPVLFEARPSQLSFERVEGGTDPLPPVVMTLLPRRLYVITSALSGKAISGRDGSPADFINLIQSAQTRRNSQYQQWRLEPLSGPDQGYYVIHSASGDKCWDVKYGDLGNGAEIIQYGCNGGDNQKWRFIPIDEKNLKFPGSSVMVNLVLIEAKHSGKVVDVPGSTLEDVPLTQYQRHGGQNQQWRLNVVE